MSSKLQDQVRYQARLKRAHESLLSYQTLVDPKYRPHWYHQRTAETLELWIQHRIRNLIVVMPPRHGKALTLDTPILTPDRGFVPMGTLRPGDKVFGVDGRPCNVVGRSPVWEDRVVYQVEGTSIVADECHEWEVETCRKRKSRAIRETRTLEQYKRAWKVRRAPALETSHKPFTDPYTLGFWLGDGSTSSLSSFFAHKDDQPFLRGRIGQVFKTTDRKSPNSFGVLGFSKTLEGHMTRGLKEFKDEWLLWDKESRLSLLQGLIDSDGYVSPGRTADTKGQVEFCNTNLSIATGVLRLVWSLGIKASMTEGRASLYGTDCGPKYRVSFYMENAASLPRKAANTRDSDKSTAHFIRFKKLERRQDTVCIEVDGPDHLFLAGYELIPTRNTQLASRAAPAWIFGRKPDAKIISAANAQTLADKNSRDVRKLMATKEHADVFGAPEYLKATDTEWELIQGGSYRAVGVGGSIAGHGADYAIIDDYVLNRQSIESPTERDKQWQWFLDDILTRRHYPASTLVMATRWHPDDIIGRLLSPEYGTGEDWHVLHLPKAYESPNGRRDAPWIQRLGLDPRTTDGECLLSPFSMAPWEYMEGATPPPYDPFLKQEAVEVTYAELQRREREAYDKRKARNPYGVAALEQGNPVPKDGGLISPSWMKRYTAQPQAAAETADRLVISIDASFKGTATSDNCSIIVMAKKGNFLYLIDEDTDKMAWTSLKARAKAMAEKYPHALVLIEDKANGTALIEELRSTIPRVKPFEPSKYGSKEARAQFAADRYESATILHPTPANAPWIDALEDELCAFPFASNDDRVDAISQAVIFLDRRGRGSELISAVTDGLTSVFGLNYV